MSNPLALSDFVVKRRPKLFEVRVGYDVYDAEGAAVLGTVEQVGRDNLEKLTRPKREDNARTILELRDESGPLLVMTHIQAAKSSLEVARAGGIELGQFKLQNLLGKSRFAITFMSGSGGADAPPEPDMKGLSMASRTWRNKSFAMTDGERELASIEMTQGTSGDASHDNQYAVRVENGLTDPVRALAFAAVFAVDRIVWSR